MGRGAGGEEADLYARAVAHCALNTVQLVSTALPSGTAGTDLCLEPIPAHGVCRESPASPPEPFWSHLLERKSACGSGPGGTCSEEWRCRVRRCAGVDKGVPRPTRLGEWAVAREGLVLAIRGPARRVPLPLRGRGMSSGSLGVRRLRGGWPGQQLGLRASGGEGGGRYGAGYGSPRDPVGNRSRGNPRSGFTHSFDSRRLPGQVA